MERSLRSREGGKQADNFNVGAAYRVPATQPPFRRAALIASMLPFSSPILTSPALMSVLSIMAIEHCRTATLGGHVEACEDAASGSQASPHDNSDASGNLARPSRIVSVAFTRLSGVNCPKKELDRRRSRTLQDPVCPFPRPSSRFRCQGWYRLPRLSARPSWTPPPLNGCYGARQTADLHAIVHRRPLRVSGSMFVRGVTPKSGRPAVRPAA